MSQKLDDVIIVRVPSEIKEDLKKMAQMRAISDSKLIRELISSALRLNAATG